MPAMELTNWISTNEGIEKDLKYCNMCLELQQSQSKSQIIIYKVSGKPWKVTGVDIFYNKNKNTLCALQIILAGS